MILPEVNIDTELIHHLSQEQAWHYQIIPARRTADVFSLYCSSSVDSVLLANELGIVFNTHIDLVGIPSDQLRQLLSQYYIRQQERGQAASLSGESQTDDFLVKLLNEAKGLSSSDIHIERYERKCRIRIRIDGMMVERYRLKEEEYPGLINKIKVKAKLDIAEKRLPQDGRMQVLLEARQLDIRVSILPTLYGEKAVLRLLNNDAGSIDLNSLGFSELDMRHYLEGIRRPTGILLISGPTGSGKTTTLYATLKLLNKDSRNIMTVEDPVEYTLEGINQVQLKESIGLDFAATLRTFLRQDPDVIMVGEIRDVNTANMAIRAALTGHLVLSTVHTNSAWGTVSRLTDMGIPPFLVASTLNTTVAQRLVRLICTDCKVRVVMEDSMYPGQYRPPSKVAYCYHGAGCAKCHFTGYKGRKAIYEVIPVDQELSGEIKNANMNIQPLLKARGIKTLAENAFELFVSGETSLEEIYPLLLNY